jgi:hypothetical protein
VFPTKILSPMVRGGYQQLFFCSSCPDYSLYILPCWLCIVYFPSAMQWLHRFKQRSHLGGLIIVQKKSFMFTELLIHFALRMPCPSSSKAIGTSRERFLRNILSRVTSPNETHYAYSKYFPPHRWEDIASTIIRLQGNSHNI